MRGQQTSYVIREQLAVSECTSQLFDDCLRCPRIGVAHCQACGRLHRCGGRLVDGRRLAETCLLCAAVFVADVVQVRLVVRSHLRRVAALFCAARCRGDAVIHVVGAAGAGAEHRLVLELTPRRFSAHLKGLKYPREIS